MLKSCLSDWGLWQRCATWLELSFTILYLQNRLFVNDIDFICQRSTFLLKTLRPSCFQKRVVLKLCILYFYLTFTFPTAFTTNHVHTERSNFICSLLALQTRTNATSSEITCSVYTRWWTDNMEKAGPIMNYGICILQQTASLILSTNQEKCV